MVSKAQACDLVLFGTKGDLARRKLLPSLYQLEKAGLLHQDTRIIGVGRAEWSQDEYHDFVRNALETFVKEEIAPAVWEVLCQRLHFCNLDVNNEADFAQLAALVESKEQVMVNYFAMPPMTYPAICRGL
ncbi:MAG: glucose-6-phosphate dehydrogenase, partial [Plesiomonas shigelloides]